MSDYSFQSETGNSDNFVYENWDKMTRVYLRSVMNQSLLDEHRSSSGSHYSEPLMRLLAWCQRRPLSEQYAVKHESDGAYRIISFIGRRGSRPIYVGDERFATLKEARHGILLCHVHDLEGR